MIIAGHTRLEAAKQLELSEVPCIIADDLTPEQIKAFRLVDNKTGELTGWDFEKLDLELEELESFDVDMSDFGFENIESKQNFIEDIVNEFSGSERHADNEYFSMTFTIDNGYKDKFDTYVKENGKDALKNVLIDEVLRIA